MSAIRLVVAVLLASAAVEAGASVLTADVSRAAIESCSAKLRELTRGSDNGALEPFDLRKRCPSLARDLDSPSGEETFSGVDIGAISLEGVRDVGAIVDGFRPAAGDRARIELDFDGLEALLDDVLIEKTTQDSLWDRFLRWLEQHVREGDSPQLGRLFDWLEDLDAPPWLGDVLIKTSTVLIILLALIVVGNELRLSGLPRRRRRERSGESAPAAADGTARARALGFDELRDLPARPLAAAIVEMVTAAFAERGWLSRDRSLTNGELLREVQARASAVVQPFSALLGSVESIVYGDRPADEQSRRRLIASAEALLEQSRRLPTASSRGAR